MSAELNQLGNIAGVTSLSINALCGCFNAFGVLYKATSAGRDLSTIRLMIRLEQHKLDSWAIAVGLFDQQPALHVSSNDAAHVPEILKELEILLTDVQRLKATYGLDVEYSTEQNLPGDLTTVESASEIPWKDRFGSSATKVLVEGRTLWRKLRWVSVDEDRVRKLLEQVRYFLGELWRYLDRAQRESLENTVKMMSRMTLSNSTDQHYLSIASEEQDPLGLGPSLNAVARLRHQGLMLDLLDGPSSEGIELSSFHVARSSTASSARTLNSGSLTSMRLSKKHLRVERVSRDILRQLAFYKNKLVLLEWRLMEAGTYEAAETRVNKISHLLHELTDSSFHSLQCMGFLEDRDLRRYGFVLDASEAVLSALNMRTMPLGIGAPTFPVSLVALREIFESMTSPSLNVRLHIAITILESVMQLHTSGWLHKALRSDNVILLKSTASIPEATIDFTRQQMYLTGYGYARSDDPAESTEPSPAQVDEELYRHPLSLGSSRMRYRMCFDLFSIGCILLEISLWSSFAKTLTQETASKPGTALGASQSEPQLYAEQTLIARRRFVSGVRGTGSEDDGAFARSIMKGVEAAAGEAYAQMVLSYLKAAENGSPEMAHGEKDFVLKLENSSLVYLRRLAGII